MPVTVHVEVQSPVVVVGDENPCFLDPVLEFVPRVFGEWITLSGFDDLTVRVELTAVQTRENHMWCVARRIDERISQSKAEIDCVAIRARGAVRAIRRLSGLQCPAMWC